MGMLFVSIGNKVTSSENNTYAAVDLNVWVSHGESMELIAPQWLPANFKYSRTDPTRLRTSKIRSVDKDNNNNNNKPHKAEPHSVTFNKKKTFSQTFDPIVNATDILRSGWNVGEKVISLRDFLKRFSHLCTMSATDGTLDWRLQYDSSSDLGTGPFWVLCNMYQFARGSERYLATISNGTIFTGYVEVTQEPILPIYEEPGGSVTSSWTPTNSNTLYWQYQGGMIMDPADRKAVEFEIPYTNISLFYCTTEDNLKNLGNDRLIPRIYFHTWTNANYTTNQIRIAAGDDFSLGWLRCPPHMSISVLPTSPKIE
jgi:hypothetical protein